MHTPPYDAYKTLENAQTNQTYGAPHPCSDVLGLDSGYLKVSGMSCSGCEVKKWLIKIVQILGIFTNYFVQ